MMKNWTGVQVRKISGKPFKSKLKGATVKAVVINEQSPKKALAFSFNEDDSVVNCSLLEYNDGDAVKDDWKRCTL